MKLYIVQHISHFWSTLTINIFEVWMSAFEDNFPPLLCHEYTVESTDYIVMGNLDESKEFDQNWRNFDILATNHGPLQFVEHSFSIGQILSLLWQKMLYGIGHIWIVLGKWPNIEQILYPFIHTGTHHRAYWFNKKRGSHLTSSSSMLCQFLGSCSFELKQKNRLKFASIFRTLR